MIMPKPAPGLSRSNFLNDNEPVVMLTEHMSFIQNEILTSDTSEITDVRMQMSKLSQKIKAYKLEEFDQELASIRLLNASKFPFYISKIVPGTKIPLKEDPKRKNEWITDFAQVYSKRKEDQRKLKHLREVVLPELRVSQGIRNIFILENLDTNLLYVVSSVYYETQEELFQQFLYNTYNKEVDSIKKSCKWNYFYVGALAERIEKGPIFQKILEYLGSQKYETYNVRYKDMTEKTPVYDAD